MKRIAMLTAAAAAVALIPGSASANHGTTCSYTSSGNTQLVNAGGVVVYEGSGMSGQADAAVGACVYTATAPPGTNFHGGTGEVGVGLTKGNIAGVSGIPGAYAIVDGDNQNAGDPLGASDGYIGVSDFETGAKGSCSGGGSGTNSGGCFQVKNVTPELPIPLIACGNTSGPNWDSTVRDGCAIP